MTTLIIFQLSAIVINILSAVYCYTAYRKIKRRPITRPPSAKIKVKLVGGPRDGETYETNTDIRQLSFYIETPYIEHEDCLKPQIDYGYTEMQYNRDPNNANVFFFDGVNNPKIHKLP